MRPKITVAVKQNPDNLVDGTRVIVRKTTFRRGGLLDRQYGLSEYGKWIGVPKKALFPDKCYLPCEVSKLGEADLDAGLELRSEIAERLKQSSNLPRASLISIDEMRDKVRQ